MFYLHFSIKIILKSGQTERRRLPSEISSLTPDATFITARKLRMQMESKRGLVTGIYGQLESFSNSTHKNCHVTLNVPLNEKSRLKICHVNKNRTDLKLQKSNKILLVSSSSSFYSVYCIRNKF